MLKKTIICLFLFALLGSAFGRSFPDAEYQKISIIFTNDMHGGIPRTEATFMNPQFPPKIGAAPALARYVEQMRKRAEAENAGVLLIDQGDFYAGTPVGVKTEGAAVVEYMNYVRYDMTTVGNHDFDLGLDVQKALAAKANFPFLGANVVMEATGEVAPWLKPYIIKEFNGIKVGILGIALASTPGMSFPDHVRGLRFEPEIATAKKWVPIVKEAGADVVIVSTHTWTPYEREKEADILNQKIRSGQWPDVNKIAATGMEIAVSVPDIDVMLTGHVHRGFNLPYEDPVNHTLIFQNYANGANVGQVNIYVHRATGTMAGYDLEVDRSSIITLLEDEFWIDPVLDNIISARVAVAEEGFDEVITVLPAPLRRSNEGQSMPGNLLCDAMVWASDADVAFTNYGGLRSDLEAGPLTYEDLFRFEPFGNRIVVFNIKGSELHALIEDRVSGNSRGMIVAGLEVTVDLRKPNRQRATIHTIQGKPFDPEAMYKLAVSDYLGEGNSGYDRLTTISPENMINTGIEMREALRDFLLTFGVKSTIDSRWRIIK